MRLWHAILLTALIAAPAWGQTGTGIELSPTAALSAQQFTSAEQPLAALDGTVSLPVVYSSVAPAESPDALHTLQAKFDAFVQKQTTTTYPNVKVGGVFQADAGFFSQDAASLATFFAEQGGRIQNGADFRRARLAAFGSVTENVNYFFQMDFAFPGRPTFTDVWVEHADMPALGTVRIGQWKQPFSLEVVSSFRYTTFMERSLLFQAFTPFRRLGVGMADYREDLTATWAASVFRSGQDQYGDTLSTNSGVGTANRVTWLPRYDEPAEGRYYTHLGLANFFNAPAHNLAIFRTNPEFFVGENAPLLPIGTSGQPVPGPLNGTPFFVTTGPMSTQWYNVVGTELLWVHGPLSVQSEAMMCFVDRINNTNPWFSGAYLQLGYFLTGEHRPYDRKAGAIDRVKPFENFFRVRAGEGTARGMGAWELAARGSTLQLKSNGVDGGSLTDVTAGVNWYWNPNTKLVFNYIAAMLSNPTFGPSTTHIFGIRAQTDF